MATESSRPKKAKEMKEQRPPLAILKEQQDDPHEWLLEHYADQPSPSASVRLEPPRSPSPSLSPVITTFPATNSASRTPTPPPTKLTPYPPAPRRDISATLEDELEELVSEPTHVAKQEQDVDMDVDLAVTELVAETLDGDADKGQDVGMEVDDELLSLVDDRLPVPSSSSRRTTSTAMALVGTLQSSKSTSRPAGDKRPASPFALTTPISATLLSVPRSSSKQNIPSSQSRSTSVLPGGSVSGDTPKAEKQEEEEDSGAENEDDKLYCVCKTKHDEDRFMIACDKYVNPSEFLSNCSLSVGAMSGIIHSVQTCRTLRLISLINSYVLPVSQVCEPIHLRACI